MKNISAYGALLERAGNRGPGAAPQNVYRARSEAGDDAWVAISVATAEQWSALRELLALEADRTDTDRIDEDVAAWCGQRSSDEIIERLVEAGVPVAKVLQPHQQTELAQLDFRRFFETVEHPVFGAARHSTLPMRFSAGPERFHVKHAPLFGEHTRSVLTSIGMSTDEIDQLEEDRVTATAPKSAAGVPR